jgi:hypothetical protein
MSTNSDKFHLHSPENPTGMVVVASLWTFGECHTIVVANDLSQFKYQPP